MTEGVALVARLVVSLGIVLGLMAAAAWALRRTRGVGGGRGRSRAVDVVAVQPLGRGSSLAVVVMGPRALVLGVTEQNVTLLAERAADEVVTESSQPPRTGAPGGHDRPAPPWTTLLDGLRERTVRRG
ncbi:MAG: flagellar biosynthetic protein FliO [Acidimicrobiia bacterium]